LNAWENGTIFIAKGRVHVPRTLTILQFLILISLYFSSSFWRILENFLALTRAWSSLLAPVQVIFPLLQMEAVV
jgi:hypothetical protein